MASTTSALLQKGEIPENNFEPFVLFTESIFHGNLDIVKGDERGAGCGGVGGLDRPRFDTFNTRNQDDRQTLLLAAVSAMRG